MRTFLKAVVLLFGLAVLILVVTATSSTDGSGPASGRATESAVTQSAVTHDQLEADAQMTQQMSTPNATGPMQSGQIQEPMLQRSENPAYVRALEQHQADIDRMLARNAP